VKPAVGIVRRGKEENHDEQQRGDTEGGIDEARRIVDRVVDMHEDEHDQHAGESPDGLLADKGVGGVEALLGDHSGRRKDHNEPGHYQQQCGEEHPLVDAY